MSGNRKIKCDKCGKTNCTVATRHALEEKPPLTMEQALSGAENKLRGIHTQSAVIEPTHRVVVTCHDCGHEISKVVYTQLQGTSSANA